MAARYAELCCRSSFSFLYGASQPHELVETVAGLGYSALALIGAATGSAALRSG